MKPDEDRIATLERELAELKEQTAARARAAAMRARADELDPPAEAAPRVAAAAQINPLDRELIANLRRSDRSEIADDLEKQALARRCASER